MSYSNECEYDDLQPKRYRALLQARYHNKEGKEATLNKEAHIYAKNDIEAEILFDTYPKLEPSQENWQVSSIECLE